MTNTGCNAEQYLYSPLPSPRHIRLAQLGMRALADSRRVLTCELHIHRLDDAPTYWTLSYAWGPPNPTTTILMDGAGDLAIRKNLADWLWKHGKKHASDVTLFWIDMLCTDQANIPERNAQVQMMREIFRRAEKLYVWLGDDNDEYSRPAMNTIIRAGKFFQHLYEDTKLELPLSTPEIYAHGMPDEWECDWPAVFRFLHRPWFERVWVQQEMVMSEPQLAVLQCGGMSIRWSWLEYVIFAIRDSGTHLNQAIRTWILHDSFVMLGTTLLPDVIEIFGQLGDYRPQDPDDPSLSVSMALCAFRGLKATDSRDNVFALLVLGSNDVHNAPEIDYRFPLTRVYRSTTAYLLVDDLDILSETGLYMRKLDGLPS